MPEYKLMAFDLDGTLLHTDKSLSEETIKALYYANEKGVELVAATGRSYEGVSPQIRALPFTRYYITTNGAAVYDRKEKSNVHEAMVPLEDAVKLYDFGRRYDCIISSYIGDDAWIQQSDKDKIESYFTDKHMMNYICSIHRGVPDFREGIIKRGKPILKFSFYFRDLDLRSRMMNEILPANFPQFVFTSSVGNNVECNYHTADKGTALTALCSYLNIPVSSSVAFGDGLNDVAMLKAAGTGVVMGNAADNIKALGDVIADTNDNDGVAKTIYSLLSE